MFNWQATVLPGKSFLYLSITDLYLYVLLRLFQMLSVNDRISWGLLSRHKLHIKRTLECVCVCMHVSIQCAYTLQFRQAVTNVETQH